MRTFMAPKLAKWPFIVSDALLLGLAAFIYAQSRLPMTSWAIVACTACIAAGAGCCVLPFILEYRVLSRLLLGEQLTDATGEIKKIELCAAQIGSATGLWQSVQDSADKTAKTAREIAERLTTEMHGFAEVFATANEGEKAALRLEVDKLRRAETEWLQVLVRVFDHIYALHQAALRSGQPALIEQIGLFQNACRDAARRIGLTPFVAAPAERYDEQRHQLPEGAPKPPAGAVVDETVATGYTYQGRLLRPALVRLRDGTSSDTAKGSSTHGKSGAGQSQLSLESTKPDLV
jgi:molecular chaperone GrpE (heat shock protein)